MSSNVRGQETTTGPNMSEIFCEDIHAIIFMSRPPLRGVLGRGKHGHGVPIGRWFAHPHFATARLYITCKSWQRCSTSKRLRCQLSTTGMIGPPTRFVANININFKHPQATRISAYEDRDDVREWPVWGRHSGFVDLYTELTKSMSLLVSVGIGLGPRDSTGNSTHQQAADTLISSCHKTRKAPGRPTWPTLGSWLMGRARFSSVRPLKLPSFFRDILPPEADFQAVQNVREGAAGGI